MLIRRRCLANLGTVLSLTVSAGFLLFVLHEYVDHTPPVVRSEKQTQSIKAVWKNDMDNSTPFSELDIQLMTDDQVHHIIPSSLNSTYKFVRRNLITDFESSLWLASRFPRIMIVGFGKTGTKALFEFLKQHPQLAGPAREVRFFSLHYERGLKHYLSALPPPPKNGFVIEKSPDYIISAEVPSRIISSAQSLGIRLSSLKYVVMLRNPIDRAVSQYLEWTVQELLERKGKRKGPFPPFESLAIDSHTGKVDISQRFINISCYAQHIERWLRYFPMEQVCFVDGDEFINRPYQVIHKLEECLELEHFFLGTHFILNANRRFYCFKNEKSKPICMNKSKGRRHPQIPSTVFNKLVKFYQGWDNRLRNITQKNWWWMDRLHLSNLKQLDAL